MDRAAHTRDTARTKRAILDGAARALRQDGATVSLTAIAKEAGVSKGGLLHHYTSKEALVLALAQDAIEQFRDRVERCVDLSENVPGKLLRGYVRAVCDEVAEPQAGREHASLWGALTLLPEVVRLAEADDERWRAAFHDDGLHPDRVLVVSRAADGLAGAPHYGAVPGPEEIEHTRELLLRMTLTNGPL
ncbi:TetR/AcrR family transcriptional regulator [Oerskovia sp. NPDC060338]|uniref:TetR/AcrR family transcriptional regulator n=1 Tax=Oerskovia sp. NPDC060338 TaxID=3347100 RepID=UPI00364AC2FA